MPSRRRLRVKFILPALTEATSPSWRPIKYSLFPPLGLATLAASLRPDYEAELVDEHVEPLDTDDCPDLVAIQVYITSARRAYALADEYRAKGVFVALGGLHVTALPDEAADHADTVFLGPGEQTFQQFLEDFRAGHPRRRYASASGRTLERLPPTRRDLIRRRLYLVPNSIVVPRGCPQHCDFCYKDTFFGGGRSFYTQRVDDALAEIRPTDSCRCHSRKASTSPMSSTPPMNEYPSRQSNSAPVPSTRHCSDLAAKGSAWRTG